MNEVQTMEVTIRQPNPLLDPILPVIEAMAETAG
jgi:hypothetical protein